jgi:hypothetical protein
MVANPYFAIQKRCHSRYEGCTAKLAAGFILRKFYAFSTDEPKSIFFTVLISM